MITDEKISKMQKLIREIEELKYHYDEINDAETIAELASAVRHAIRQQTTINEHIIYLIKQGSIAFTGYAVAEIAKKENELIRILGEYKWK